MEVKTGTSSIQVASFKYVETRLQDNYIAPDYALQLLHFAIFHGSSFHAASLLTLQTVVVKRKSRSNVSHQTLPLGVSCAALQRYHQIIKLRSVLSSPFL